MRVQTHHDRAGGSFGRHHAQRYADGAWVYNEGDVEVGYKYPEQVFQIPYRVMLPSASEITNLVVPVCVSARFVGLMSNDNPHARAPLSHIGYGALRLEPQYVRRCSTRCQS